MPRKPIDGTLASEAVNIVTGPRQQAYDHPADNFARIAGMWSVIFGTAVTPKQVGLAMVAVKLCREIHSHQRDNFVDAIGYLLTSDACQED